MTNGFYRLQRTAQRFGVLPEAISAGPRITLSGAARVRIEGHRGLLEYAPDRIAAAGAGCRVIVKGEALALAAMDRETMEIAGRIWAVELE